MDHCRFIIFLAIFLYCHVTWAEKNTSAINGAKKEDAQKVVVDPRMKINKTGIELKAKDNTKSFQDDSENFLDQNHFSMIPKINQVKRPNNINIAAVLKAKLKEDKSFQNDSQNYLSLIHKNNQIKDPRRNTNTTVDIKSEVAQKATDNLWIKKDKNETQLKKATKTFQNDLNNFSDVPQAESHISDIADAKEEEAKKKVLALWDTINKTEAELKVKLKSDLKVFYNDSMNFMGQHYLLLIQKINQVKGLRNISVSYNLNITECLHDLDVVDSKIYNVTNEFNFNIRRIFNNASQNVPAALDSSINEFKRIIKNDPGISITNCEYAHKPSKTCYQDVIDHAEQLEEDAPKNMTDDYQLVTNLISEWTKTEETYFNDRSIAEKTAQVENMAKEMKTCILKKITPDVNNIENLVFLTC